MTNMYKKHEKKERLGIVDFIKSHFPEEERITENRKDPNAIIYSDVKNFGKVSIFLAKADKDEYLKWHASKLTDLDGRKALNYIDEEVPFSEDENVVYTFLQDNVKHFRDVQLDNIHYLTGTFNLKKATKTREGKEVPTELRYLNLGKKYNQHILLRVPMGSVSKVFNEEMNKLKGVVTSYVSFVFLKKKEGEEFPKKYGFRFFVLDKKEVLKK